MERGIERRRSIRIKKLSLKQDKLDTIDKPSIKIAETLSGYRQAFELVYREYEAAGYITEPHPSRMQYDIFSLLPTTCVFVFKEYQKVISTLTQVADSELFGLPMDSLYRKELDVLRNKGRKIVEIRALATDREYRSENLVLYLGKAFFQYANLNNVNDICIMVNPKHVNFYKTLLFFEDFGEEKMYGKVNAPAVALRINFDTFWDKLESFFSSRDFETNLYTFFYRVNKTGLDKYMHFSLSRNIPLDYAAARFFLAQRRELLDKLNERQRSYIETLYNKALYAEGALNMVDEDLAARQ